MKISILTPLNSLNIQILRYSSLGLGSMMIDIVTY